MFYWLAWGNIGEGDESETWSLTLSKWRRERKFEKSCNNKVWLAKERYFRFYPRVSYFLRSATISSSESLLSSKTVFGWVSFHAEVQVLSLGSEVAYFNKASRGYSRTFKLVSSEQRGREREREGWRERNRTSWSRRLDLIIPWTTCWVAEAPTRPPLPGPVIGGATHTHNPLELNQYSHHFPPSDSTESGTY